MNFGGTLVNPEQHVKHFPIFDQIRNGKKILCFPQALLDKTYLLLVSLKWIQDTEMTQIMKPQVFDQLPSTTVDSQGIWGEWKLGNEYQFWVTGTLALTPRERTPFLKIWVEPLGLWSNTLNKGKKMTQSQDYNFPQ